MEMFKYHLLEEQRHILINGLLVLQLIRIKTYVLGIYFVEVTDVNSCAITTSVEISEPSEISADIPSNNVINVNCEGWNTGVATVNVNGGSPTVSGYTYFWADVNDLLSPLSFTETASDLPIGTLSGWK